MITSGSAPDDVKCHQSHSHIGKSVASCPAPPQTVHASLTPTHASGHSRYPPRRTVACWVHQVACRFIIVTRYVPPN